MVTEAANGHGSILGRAWGYLDKMDRAVSGQGGHKATFKAACRLVIDFDLGRDDAFGLLKRWNEDCKPPWSDKDLWHKVDEAGKQAGPRGRFTKEMPKFAAGSSAGKGSSGGKNSYAQPIESNSCAYEFPQPVLLSKLKGVDQAALWCWDGYLASQSITLLSALWKAGKSTLLAHLLKEMDAGGILLGQKVTASGALIISEEPENLWVKRRDDLGIGDHVHTLIRPLKGKPDLLTWVKFLDFVAQFIRDEGIGLVVFDTLTQFWPVLDENNASEVTSAMLPARKLSDAGAATLFIHHPRKSDGDQATSARGSGALAGFVDIILEFRRFNPADRSNRQRVMSGYSRYSSTPDEVVAELASDGRSYLCQGDRADANRKHKTGIILGILPQPPGSMAADEIAEAWPTESKPSKRSLEIMLPAGMDAGDWRRSGGGKKGDPYRYWRD